ncbi:hypothetical protein PIB30_035548 [Stylosanthes scabra]|uniref:phosphopantothenoylcysteine decarboxylase n=1 Tax=Stylosanthes scabra TaxID=79078 RepID=A0ABU6SEF4_9FABA|nr:hypothetical protein [Stylosanthes scabra]
MAEEEVGQNFTTDESSRMKSAGPGPARRRLRVLLAACGCQSAKNFALVCQSFITWADVRVVLTNPAWRFVNLPLVPDGSVTIHSDSAQWLFWQKHSYGLHVELQKWADIMVIAPMSANTMAKMLGGLCDNLLTCIIRIWDYKKPLYAAPSMEPSMWDTPLTVTQIQSLHKLGIIVITDIGKITDGLYIHEHVAVSEYVRLNYLGKSGAE